MQSFRISPPWEFLLSASRNSLQSYGLSRLSHASNLRKEISALIDQWVEENTSAMLARWLMEHRGHESAIVEPADAAPQKSAAGATASDNFLTDFVNGRSNILYGYI